MPLHPILIALAAAAAGGQDPAPWAAPSYRAVVSLDEQARELRGTVTIVVRAAGTGARDSLRIVAGAAALRRVRMNGADLEAFPADSEEWVVPSGEERAAGDSLVLEIDFAVVDAAVAAAATPDRSDRRFDFRAWLPRLAAERGSAPLPGTFLVTLDVPEDQVVAATGVPLCGDPGWSAARRPKGRPVTSGRTAYADPRDAAARALPPGACAPAATGRKTIVWYAEDVRDLAITMAPDYRYEEGDFLERPVRALYPAGEERTWGAGVAVRRSETALAWLHEVFDGRAPNVFPWPQTTTVKSRDLEEQVDPMVVASASAGQERLLVAFGEMYLGEAVAVDPGDRAWLEEGLARFQADLYFETQGRRWGYRRLERAVLDEELDGRARPVLPAEGLGSGNDAPRRAELLFHELRLAAGDSVTFAILKTYWARARLREAGESLFVAVADSIAGGDLGRRLAAMLRDAEPVDYAVGGARRERLADGRWRTTVEVRRRGGLAFPVEVQVVAPGGAVTVRSPGVAARETVTVVTAARPTRVTLDPAVLSHDWNVLNNRRTFGFHLGGDRPASDYLDPYFTRPSRRDRLARSWAPVAWYNDAGGWTVGVRRRDDYLGRFDLGELWLALATGVRAGPGRQDLDWRVVLRNPTWLRSPGVGERLEAGMVEGRSVASVGVDWGRGAHTAGLALTWVGATTTAYLDPAQYERAATLEATAAGRVRWGGAAGTERAGAGLALSGGLALRGDALPPSRTREPYARIAADAEGEHVLGSVHLRARAWAAAALASGPLLRQRLVYFNGPDPYQLLGQPFLRSRGGLFLRPGFHYHEPGGAGLRGFDPDLAGRQAYGVGVESEYDLARGRQPEEAGLFSRVSVALFADGALGDGDLDATGKGRLTGAADAGFGLRADHRIGATAFVTRMDFPLWVSAPSLAQDTRPGTRRWGFRWTCSLAPAL